MTEFLFHPEAQAEFAAAIRWYDVRSPRTAVRFEAELETVLAQIGDSPEMFPKYDSQRRFALLRRFPYSVVYEMQVETVYVVAIAHSSREPGYWQERV